MCLVYLKKKNVDHIVRPLPPEKPNDPLLNDGGGVQNDHFSPDMLPLSSKCALFLGLELEFRSNHVHHPESFLLRSIPEWSNLTDQARNAAAVDSFRSFLTSNVNFEKL